MVDGDGNHLRSVILPEPLALIQGHAGIPCFLWRRLVWKHVGPFSEDLFLAEDYEYWLRILAAGLRVAPLHACLYEYRRHERSLTDAHRGHTFAAAEQALLRHLPRLASLDRSVPGDAWLYLASLATWRGDHARAAHYTLRAFACAPLRATRYLGAHALRKLAGTPPPPA